MKRIVADRIDRAQRTGRPKDPRPQLARKISNPLPLPSEPRSVGERTRPRAPRHEDLAFARESCCVNAAGQSNQATCARDNRSPVTAATVPYPQTLLLLKRRSQYIKILHRVVIPNDVRRGGCVFIACFFLSHKTKIQQNA